MAAAVIGVANGVCQSYLNHESVRETRELVAELCRHFYTQGWVSGTGGSISIKVHDDSIPKSQQLIVMSPSGVQKERMIPEDMYVLSSAGSIISAPSAKPYPHKPPKCTDCAPLFMKAFEMRNAGAVIHSHGMESCLVTMIQPFSKEFRITHMEMIKGIDGHGYYDELVVPIIENTAHEGELTESLSEAIQAYPKTTAVLVRNHGIYVWGDSWIRAKTQAECYHYLFDAAIKLYQLGLDWSTPSHGPIQRVFDGQRNINMAVNAGVQNLNNALELSCVEEDLHQGVAGAVPIPTNDAGKDEVIAYLVANVEAMIKADRKITGLKQLQGHIWRTGFQNNELKGVVFEDVPDALQKWHAMGIKVYIYSSGSREAQRLLFGNSNYGDLRKFLCGFFDTTVGNKKETQSYFEISQSLGVDEPSDILFVTDVFQEAVAAKGAGLEVIISVRPGNAPLPENHGFKTVQSFVEI
ncbi:probable bifunctional methylthioribulose-1-phosphate dehydratase/enolase-phosphatase E1 1 isoform X2 [Macadamia integrifolia]|uniref:probable bifunctional methylthioribulose-1-phosphate dehydratase/enolase-phosphatase E1 1 isoform X2 n=1 Tax=Macadamia integrifolia TaxID=60698 RepID=UPI001C4F5E9F|nr:probable bifunctional methylthioribulose-1-phosphate dehydratase/enolase-phosphatase E1 1 isoform X2 [Macadamia integrifolia]